MADGQAQHSRLHALDGLRALAVLLVFAHHVNQRVLPGGYVGVDVFFVLSGYLITFLLLSEHRRFGDISLRRFYARRALRLYPALLTMVLVVGIVSAIDDIGRPLPDALCAAVYLTDFWANVKPDLSLVAHTWSLAVEEQFYVVWPAVLIYALRRNWHVDWVVWGLIAVNLAITFGLAEANLKHAQHIQYLPFAHVSELGAGILLALQVHRGPSRLVRSLAHPAVGAAALGLMAGVEGFLKAHWWAFPLDTIVCWPVVATLVLTPHTKLARVFSVGPMVWLGERSYGFYLWHYPVLIFMAIHGASAILRIALGGSLTLIIVVASWELVETPFLRRKRHFERPAGSQVAVEA